VLISLTLGLSLWSLINVDLIGHVEILEEIILFLAFTALFSVILYIKFVMQGERHLIFNNRLINPRSEKLSAATRGVMGEEIVKMREEACKRINEEIKIIEQKYRGKKMTGTSKL